MSRGNNLTDHENSGQDVVILRETDQELQLNQHAVQVELKAQQVVESFPFYLSSSEEYLVDFQPTFSDTKESLPTSSPAVDLLQQVEAIAYPTETHFESQHPTVLEKGTAASTEVYESPQNTSLQPSVYNKTDSHHIFNLTIHESDTEITTSLVKSTSDSDTQKQPVTDRSLKDETEALQGPNDSQEIDMITLNVSRVQHDNKESERNHKENLWDGNLDQEVKLEDTTVKAPVQRFLSTQTSTEDDELVTQTAQTTESSTKNQTSIWAPQDGSGDASQGTSHIKNRPKNEFRWQTLFTFYLWLLRSDSSRYCSNTLDTLYPLENYM